MSHNEIMALWTLAAIPLAAAISLAVIGIVYWIRGEFLALRARNAKLEAALLPFANAVDDAGRLKGATASSSYRVDFMHARATLSEPPQ